MGKRIAFKLKHFKGQRFTKVELSVQHFLRINYDIGTKISIHQKLLGKVKKDKVKYNE